MKHTPPGFNPFAINYRQTILVQLQVYCPHVESAVHFELMKHIPSLNPSDLYRCGECGAKHA